MENNKMIVRLDGVRLCNSVMDLKDPTRDMLKHLVQGPMYIQFTEFENPVAFYKVTDPEVKRITIELESVVRDVCIRRSETFNVTSVVIRVSKGWKSVIIFFNRNVDRIPGYYQLNTSEKRKC